MKFLDVLCDTFDSINNKKDNEIYLEDIINDRILYDLFKAKRKKSSIINNQNYVLEKSQLLKEFEIKCNNKIESLSKNNEYTIKNNNETKIFYRNVNGLNKEFKKLKKRFPAFNEVIDYLIKYTEFSKKRKDNMFKFPNFVLVEKESVRGYANYFINELSKAIFNQSIVLDMDNFDKDYWKSYYSIILQYYAQNQIIELDIIEDFLFGKKKYEDDYDMLSNKLNNYSNVTNINNCFYNLIYPVNLSTIRKKFEKYYSLNKQQNIKSNNKNKSINVFDMFYNIIKKNNSTNDYEKIKENIEENIMSSKAFIIDDNGLLNVINDIYSKLYYDIFNFRTKINEFSKKDLKNMNNFSSILGIENKLKNFLLNQYNLCNDKILNNKNINFYHEVINLEKYKSNTHLNIISEMFEKRIYDAKIIKELNLEKTEISKLFGIVFYEKIVELGIETLEENEDYNNLIKFFVETLLFNFETEYFKIAIKEFRNQLKEINKKNIIYTDIDLSPESKIKLFNIIKTILMNNNSILDSSKIDDFLASIIDIISGIDEVDMKLFEIDDWLDSSYNIDVDYKQYDKTLQEEHETQNNSNQIEKQEKVEKKDYHLCKIFGKTPNEENIDNNLLLNYITKVKNLKNGCKKIKLINEKYVDILNQLRNEFPNFSNYIDYLEEELAIKNETNKEFLLSPALLVGSAGVGKTYFVMKLTEYFGVRFYNCNLSSVDSASAITGHNSTYLNSTPGMVFYNFIENDVVNNIMLLDEIDKSTNTNFTHISVQNTLLNLLEKETAKRFKDQFIDVEIDANKLNFIATANDIKKISLPLLNRFRVFEIRNPNIEERKIILTNIYNKLLKELQLEEKFERQLDSNILNEIAKKYNGKSCRDMKNLINGYIGKTILLQNKENGLFKITEKLIEINFLKEKPVVGFI